MVCFDKNTYHCQRAIYISKILSKHFVFSPSVLKLFPFDFLRSLAYSEEVFVFDFVDASKRFNNSLIV